MAHHVHVVLTEDLSNLGKSGELVRVRPGFARNYLLPRGLAVSATEENKSRIEHEKKVAEARAAKARATATDLSQKLSSVKISIARPVGENEKLYGSVTTRDIEEALAQQGYTVDRRRIDTEPLKNLGTFQVPIHLATSVTATVAVTVVAK